MISLYMKWSISYQKNRFVFIDYVFDLKKIKLMYHAPLLYIENG